MAPKIGPAAHGRQSVWGAGVDNGALGNCVSIIVRRRVSGSDTARSRTRSDAGRWLLNVRRPFS